MRVRHALVERVDVDLLANTVMVRGACGVRFKVHRKLFYAVAATLPEEVTCAECQQTQHVLEGMARFAARKLMEGE